MLDKYNLCSQTLNPSAPVGAHAAGSRRAAVASIVRDAFLRHERDACPPAAPAATHICPFRCSLGLSGVKVAGFTLHWTSSNVEL